VVADALDVVHLPVVEDARIWEWVEKRKVHRGPLRRIPVVSGDGLGDIHRARWIVTAADEDVNLLKLRPLLKHHEVSVGMVGLRRRVVVSGSAGDVRAFLEAAK